MRFYYLDNLRALLMILGIVLHTCAAFSVQQYWLVTYTTPLPWADGLNEFIHLFRMPMFFIVSGFFAFLVLQKQSVWRFSRTKLLRVGLPFIVVLIAINLPQFLTFQNTYPLSTAMKVNLSANSLVGHLWFLVNLLVYFLIYSIVHGTFVRCKRWAEQFSTLLLILISSIVLPSAYLILLALNKIGIPIYQQLPILGSLFQVFAYFDFFLLGVIFALIPHQYFLKALSSMQGVFLILIMYGLGAAAHMYQAQFPIVLEPYSLRLITVAICLTIVVISSSVLESQALWIKSIADASYSIYLFHHTLVIFCVLGLNYLATQQSLVLSPTIAFILVLISVFVTTLAIHYYIVRKHKLLTLLFNGKP